MIPTKQLYVGGSALYKVYKRSLVYDVNGWMIIIHHLIIIWARGKSKTYVLNQTTFAGNSLQGHPPNKVKHLRLGTLSY